MRRLEEVLHDLAEQDERLPTNELITRIERRLSGESDVPVVVMDGRLEMDAYSNTPRTRRRRWAPALVAAGAALLVLLVVGLPILFFNGDESIVADQSTTTVASTTVPPTTTSPTTARPTTIPSAAVDPFPPSDLAVLEVPLSEAVPGFTETIVMTAWSADGTDVGVMRWRASESMPELLLSLDPAGGAPLVGLDASERWAAQILDDNVLTVQAVPTVPGEPSQREIVGHEVQGERTPQAVWHDTAPGHLAWLECPNFRDGPTTLFTLDVSDPSANPIRLRTFDQGCAGNPWGDDEPNAGKPSVTLVRWGGTGVWVTKYSEDTEGQDVIESVVVDADGAEIAMVSDAWMIAMSPGGTSIWRRSDWENPCFVVSPDGQQRSTVPGLSDEDFLGRARWSPDGTRLAIWVNTDGGRLSGEDVLRIVDSVSGDIITELRKPVEPDWESAAAWSTDNRFFVYAPDSEGPATLVFYDTATNAATTILIAEDVWDIRVR